MTSDPNISTQRATAIMAVWRSWVALEHQVADYNALVLKEDK